VPSLPAAGDQQMEQHRAATLRVDDSELAGQAAAVPSGDRELNRGGQHGHGLASLLRAGIPACSAVRNVSNAELAAVQLDRAGFHGE
jgi:hypothetical protein